MVPINKHQFRVFENAFGPKDEARPLQRLKGVDASVISLCEAVVKKKVQRTNFVARMWKVACSNHIPKWPDFGWELLDGPSHIVWFIGPQMPESVVPETALNDSEDNNEDDDYLSDDDEETA